MTRHTDTLSTLGLSVEQVCDLPTPIRNGLVSYLLRWEEFAVARCCLQQLLVSHSHLVSVYDALARAYLGEDRPDLAFEIMRRRHELRTSSSSRILEARIHLAAGDIPAAQAIATELTTEHADLLSAWDLQADVCVAKGDWQVAEAALRQRESLRPGASGTAMRLARLWQARGDTDKALLWAQTALARVRRDGQQAGAQLLRLLEHLYRATGQQAQTKSIVDELSHRQQRDLDDLLEILSQELSPAKSLPKERVAIDVPMPAPVSHGFPEVIVGAVQPTHEELGRLQSVLASHFAHQQFRPGQIDVMTTILRAESVLAVMPTGSGKSLCYQLASQLLPGTTLVISPLIALMKDQVDGLPPSIAKRATTLNYTLDGAELDTRMACAETGTYKLLYAAPERLRQRPFLSALQSARVSLLVVDEAHCVSLWGHDFRPDYLFISKAWRELGKPPILAMTATATPRVRDDIQNALGGVRLIVTDVHRPNLRLEAQELRGKANKNEALLRLCQAINGSGIVYSRARKTCEDLALMLRQHGVEAIHYHAGLHDRAAVQDRFMTGAARIVVATIAFGMGIDKADVRFIIHYDPPQSLENYYQEAGRAGRDGLPARCILFHSPADRATLSHLMRQDRLDMAFLRTVYAAIESRAGRQGLGLLAAADLQRDVAAEETKVRVAVQFLERAGLLRRGFDLPRSATLMLKRNPDQPDDEAVRFLEAARLRPGQRIARSLLRISEEAGLDARTIEAQLLEWASAGWLEYRGTGRDMLLELMAAPRDSRQRLAAMLAEHQSGQEGRLGELKAYAITPECRHGFLSRYFGGLTMLNCQSCDNCLGTSQIVPRKPHVPRAVSSSPIPDETVAIVLESIRQLPFPLDRTGLARALTGSTTSPVSADRFPRFGALSSHTQKATRNTVLSLVERGLLDLQMKQGYQLVRLTKQGEQWLQQHPKPSPAPSQRRWPTGATSSPGARSSEAECAPKHPASSQRATTRSDDLPFDETLFERLRAWRLEVARSSARSPYLIFHNSVLERIASLRPTTFDELSTIKGVGPKKLSAYGPALIDIITSRDEIQSTESD